MKTSKIILFSYIGLLATAFLIFVIYLGYADENYKSIEEGYITIEEDLPSFKYIDVDGQFVRLENDGRTYLSAFLKENSGVSNINYSISNDTLYIFSTEGIDQITLHLNGFSNFTLINHNAHVVVNGFKADTMNYLAMANSQISGFNNSNITFVNADLTESQFNAYQGSINKLNLISVKSSVNIRVKMSSVKAQISDNSNVALGNCDKIDIEKDQSSVFRCFP